MLRKILLICLAGLVVLVGVLAFNAARLRSRQVAAEPGAAGALDTSRAALHLAEAIRFRTVSHEDASKIDRAEFLRLHEYLQRTYPKVHAALARETVKEYSLLYRWEGADAATPAAVLMGHMDVVPAEEGGQGKWKAPPFEGRIENGVVWGRGAIDDKVNVIGILEALEALLGEGFRPRRTIYLAFGHDEELEGTGAAGIAASLEARGVRVEFVLDEGGLIGEGLLPGVTAPVAAVAIGEKGYMDVELAVEGEGGHSSTPPVHTAVGVLSRAIAKLEENPFPAGVEGVARTTLEYAAPEMGFGLRMVMANLWLTSPLVQRIMEGQASAAAQIRTTTAVTMVEGSPKPNVLPQRARAVVNFRLLPGETTAGVLEHVRRVVGDGNVQVRMLTGAEAPPVADAGSGPAKVLQRAVKRVYPEAVYAPVLSTGGTDARHYARLTRDVFRFVPIRATEETFKQMHGTNEQIPAADFERAVRFYAELIRELQR